MKLSRISWLICGVSAIYCKLDTTPTTNVDVYLPASIRDKMATLFYFESKMRQEPTYPFQYSYPISTINSTPLDKDEVISRQVPVIRPIIPANCVSEVKHRYNTYPLDSTAVYGYSLGEDVVNMPSVPTITLGKVNLTMVNHLELSELTDCAEITLPQLIYLIASDNIGKMHDSCISTIKPGLFTLLTPGLAESFFEHKPSYITQFWRYFDPVVLARSPIVMDNILKNSHRSFLCCNLLAGDFDHVNNLRNMSDECIASIFTGEKCKNIPASFFQSGPLSEYNPKFNSTALTHLLPTMINASDMQLPKNQDVTAAISDSIKIRVLELMDISCFENLPPETRQMIWNNYKDTHLNKHIVNKEQCRKMLKLMASSNMKNSKCPVNGGSFNQLNSSASSLLTLMNASSLVLLSVIFTIF